MKVSQSKTSPRKLAFLSQNVIEILFLCDNLQLKALSNKKFFPDAFRPNLNVLCEHESLNDDSKELFKHGLMYKFCIFLHAQNI